LENDPESMRDALQMFDAQGLAEFKAFLEYLIERGWLMK
jgi:putative heme degradation protein